jgi:pimeloyl-ACP methyl ester carboxylesterase
METRFWNRRWRVASHPQEKHFVRTPDGFQLALERYRGLPLKERSPVILCHGLAANSRFMDLTDEQSLARYLWSNGHDVWNLSLRGTGESSRIISTAPSRWTIDDMIHTDLPEVIRYVRMVTGKRQIHWVGHSLGGSVVIGYLETEDPSVVKSFVGIASPVIFPYPLREPMKTLLKLGEMQLLKRLFLGLNTRVLSQMILPFVDLIPPFCQRFFYNPDNVGKATKKQLLENTVADLNGGVLDQLLFSIRNGELTSSSGETSYFRGLKKVHTPAFLLAGQVDHSTPPESVGITFDHVASQRKQIRLFGPSVGTLRPYGHLDLIVGIDAKQEVFPWIASWLEKITDVVG